MTLPTETWHQSQKFVKVITNTNADLIQFIKESLDTNDTNWVVAGWSGAGVNPSWLIIKRKGTEDNQRLTLFSSAGTTPNAASLESGMGAAVAYLYAYATMDRPLTTIDGNPQTGDIFASTPVADKFKGRTLSQAVPTAGAAVLTILSTPSTLLLNIQAHGANSCASVIFGKCIQLQDDADNVALFTSQAIFNTAPSSNSPSWFFFGDYDAAQHNTYRTGGVKYNVGRLWPSLSSNPALTNSALGGVLHDISLVARIAGTALAWEYVGRLRQIRFGPQVVDRARIYSGASLVAYHSCPPNGGAIQTGIYMDNVA